jgi:hypothetical protein
MLKDVKLFQIGGITTLYGNVEIVSIYIDKVIGLSHRYTLKGDTPVILFIVICVLISLGYLNKYNRNEKLVKIDCYNNLFIKKNDTFTKNMIFICMGRKQIKTEDKKIRMSITIDPNIEKIIKDKHINLSSLANKLLTEYFSNEKNM